ncbi:PEP-utilizing enzyme [Burkholderia multivorans]|uniref:PEP-utilizing enzyme n=1 Tax=Burkholderia multivorans TaxID=87883 RepID=UPI0009BFE16A|nr:PEP-utilizing enzyme [Burkholderia multivorans]
MTKYIYGGKFKKTHTLNAIRLGAGEPTIQIDDLQKQDASGSPEDVWVFGDWLLMDNKLRLSIDSSKADVSFFISDEKIEHDTVRQFCNLFGIDRTDENSRAIAVHATGNAISKALNRDVADLNISIRIVKEPIFCTPDFSIREYALTTKGKTLGFFAGLLHDATVDPGVVVERSDWLTSRHALIDRIVSNQWPTVIVRSSAVSEDSFSSSNAGAYTTVMNVRGSDVSQIGESVDIVFNSYADASPLDQVLLQKQITDPLISGVCSSRVVGKNSPYFVINYDDTSGRTDTVTSGGTNELKTLYVARSATGAEIRAPRALCRLVSVVRQIECLSDHQALDIEFIIDRNELIHIVQVRPLVGGYNDSTDGEIEDRILFARKVFETRSKNCDGILKGERVAFGIMPDANPAELIGIKPRPLAFSLYQRLITDTVVTNQRKEYGYRDVRPIQHMLKIGGNPYIDVRSSFNSFTPAAISDSLAGKLIDLYIDRLERNPSLHDKVEFEIVVSTWFPGLAQWFRDRYGNALSVSELDEICEAAKEIFYSAVERVECDHNEVESYRHLFDSVMSSDDGPLYKSWKLIEICHHYGCKPFAHLARSAFVAVSTLKGLVRVGALSADEYEDYLHSIQSVSGALERDAYAVKTGLLDKNVFYARYGHLRPGTYDITSPAYFEDPARYLDPLIAGSNPSDKTQWRLSAASIEKINAALATELDGVTWNTFDHFARRAIHGREHGKFTYTRFLSHGMNQLLAWTGIYGLTREETSYLHLHDIDEIISGTQKVSAELIKRLVAKRKQEYDCDCKIELPDLIFDQVDFFSFHKLPGQPNFITNSAITQISANVSPMSDPSDLGLYGKIAVIESADPGYDWLFGHSISGLITRYGGANSHMAIRCAELGIPAAIGVGDVIYTKATGARRIMLDCAAKKITIID